MFQKLGVLSDYAFNALVIVAVRKENNAVLHNGRMCFVNLAFYDVLLAWRVHIGSTESYGYQLMQGAVNSSQYRVQCLRHEVQK